MRGRKLSRLMGGSIDSRMEICEILVIHVGIVPRFHKRNVYIKTKLLVRRTQKCIALVCGNPHQPVRVCKLPCFMGGSIRPRMEICQITGLPIPMVPHLHQSNRYIKRKLRIWIAQKSIVLVGAETVLSSAGPQTTLFYGGQYKAEIGNMRNFWPTNPHGTAFALMQWSYQKEATGMESSKIYCSSRCRNSTYQGGAENYPV